MAQTRYQVISLYGKPKLSTINIVKSLGNNKVQVDTDVCWPRKFWPAGNYTGMATCSQNLSIHLDILMEITQETPDGAWDAFKDSK